MACTRNNADSISMEQRNQAITDSLKAGNCRSAEQMVDRGMAEATDSDEYYNYLVQGALADYYCSNPERMALRARKALLYLEKEKYSPLRQHLLTKCYGALGAGFVQYSYNEDSCIYYQQKALQSAYQEPDKRETLQAMGNLADSYRLSGKLDLSSNMYLRAIALADSLEAPASDYIPLYGGLAGTYTSLKEFSQSRKWLDKEGELWGDMSQYEQFNYLNNSGNDYYLSENYSKALKEFLRLDSLLSKRDGVEWERHFCSTNLSDVYIALGDYAKAEAPLEDNFRYFTAVQPNTYAAEHIVTQKMRLQSVRGNHDSVAVLIKSHPITSEMRPEQKLLRLDFLRNYYARTGSWEKAYAAEIDYSHLNDSVRNERVKLSSHARRLDYEHDKRLLSMNMEMAEQRLKTELYIYVLVLALFIIGLLIVLMRMRRREQKDRESRMIYKIQELRMADIRRRVTPHFIYNILNHVLAKRSKGEPDDLDTIVALMRRQQVVADELLVPLSEELKFVDSYVAIMSDGLSSPVDYKLNVDAEVDSQKVKIPSMTVQIFVENAFKHGFPTLPEGDVRLLLIEVVGEREYVEVSVCNNSGKCATAYSDSTRQGLKIVDTTLQLLNEVNRLKGSLSVGEWSVDGTSIGYKVTLRIPKNFSIRKS